MKSNYNQLGQYIEMVSRTNSDLKYGIEDVRGCSNTKQMMQTRANLIGRTYEKFIVLRPQEFVFNRRTTRNGEKIGMAYNNTDREYIFTNDYVAFRVKQEYLDKLLPDYLYMFFCRDEFDRYARYKSTGSATEFFNWEDMCAVPFEIPPMDFQQLVVNAYKVLNERIETKQKINDNLATQALTLFSDFVSHRSKKLEQRKLGNVIASANTGGDAIQKVPIVDYDTGIKCARVGDITNAREYASWAFCNASKSVYDNYKLQAGDILVTRTATLGITQYIAKDISAVYNNGLIRLKVDDTNALSLYIYWAMKTSDFLNYINQMNSATSVRPNMKIDYLLNYQLSIPSIEEQTQFTNAVEPLMKAISLNNDEILKLSEFQAIILTTLSSR